MSWYRTGTINLTKGSADVTGVGTAFLSEVRVFDILLVAGALYEIKRVPSDTALTLMDAYQGASVSGTAYAVIRNMTNASNLELMKKIEEFLSGRQKSLDEFTNWLNGEMNGGAASDGKYPLTDRYGVTQQIKSPAQLIGELDAVRTSGDTTNSSLKQALTDAETRLKNIGDQQTWADQILGYKNDAATSAANAKTSETNAATSLSNAKTSENNAKTSETNAKASENAAAASRDAAAKSLADAQTARDQAKAAAAASTGNLTEMGGIDLSSGQYPAIPEHSSFWKVTVAGTVNGVDYGVGDTLVYSLNLSEFYKIDSTESVTSVNGKKGIVTVTLNELGGAPLASPKLTGTPSAPTVVDGSDRTDLLATTKFVQMAMQLLGLGTTVGVTKDDFNASLPTGIYRSTTAAVNGPITNVAMNWLNLRWNDGGGAQLVFGTSSNKDVGKMYWRTQAAGTWTEWRETAMIDSPAFKGKPTVPTAAAGDNSGQAASTAYVQTAIAGKLDKTGGSLTGDVRSSGSVTLANGSDDAPNLSWEGKTYRTWVDLFNSSLRIYADKNDNTIFNVASYDLAAKQAYIFDQKVWHAGNFAPGNAATKNIAVAQSLYGGVAYVNTDGVMEVGPYIDFHTASNDGADYQARLSADNSGLYITPANGAGVGKVWTTATLNPPRTYTTIDTTRMFLQSNNPGPIAGIANGSGDDLVAATIYTDNQYASAVMSFYRNNGVNGFATYFGIDTDNQLKVGGRSMGANAYPIWHDGMDWMSRIRNGIAAMGAGEIGTYGLFVVGGGGGTSPGTLVAGSNLRWASAGTYNPSLVPTGTWRIMSWITNADGSGTDSTALCLRVS